MLKTTTFAPGGRDAGAILQLTELPALVADRAARAALREIDADLHGGVVALALRHLKDVRALGERGLYLLTPFVNATRDGEPVSIQRAVRDWRNVDRLIQMALQLHVGFLVGREQIEVPVAMQGAHIMSGKGETRVTFCSPHIAAVLDSRMADYVALETVLSTEDVYNLVEVLNVRAVRDWHAAQQNKP